MSQADREKWDERYQKASHGTRTAPSVFLSDWLKAQDPGKDTYACRALDVACGTGRNSICLAQAGYRVDAMDISTQALSAGQQRAGKLALEINWLEVDLDELSLDSDQYDVIILFRCKKVQITGLLLNALRPGGAFLCEQHLVTNHEVLGPGSSKFRWQPGELKDMVSGASEEIGIQSYFEGLVQDPDKKPAALARIVAVKRDR